MNLLGYDVANLSIKDFTNGGEFIKTLAKQSKVNLTSASVVYTANSTPIVEPYVIRKLTPEQRNPSPPFDQLTIGLIGVCDPREKLLHNRFNEDQLKSIDPVAAVKNVLPKVRKKADLVILLFNGRYQNLTPILETVKEIDIVIMGGEYYRARTYQGDDVIITSVASLGKYGAYLQLTLDQDKTIINSTKTQVPLDKSIDDDPTLAKLVAEYKKAQEKLLNPPRQQQRSSSAQ